MLYFGERAHFDEVSASLNSNSEEGLGRNESGSRANMAVNLIDRELSSVSASHFLGQKIKTLLTYLLTY